jgi:hypothetical protein
MIDIIALLRQAGVIRLEGPDREFQPMNKRLRSAGIR